MSNCPSCNTINPDDYQFCQFCGSKIVTTSVDQYITQPLNSEALSANDDLASNWEISNQELANLFVDNAIAITVPIDIPEMQQTAITKENVIEENVIEENISENYELKDFGDGLSEDANKSLESKVIMSSDRHGQNVTYAGKTDVGKQRDRNEDDFTAIFQTRNIHGKSQIRDRSYRGLFVLCDGMGGHAGGAEASAIVVNSITNQFLPFWIDTLPGKKKLNEIIAKANQEIFLKNETEKRQSLGRMGTTLAMLALHDLNVAIAYVGDSRIYKVTSISSVPKLEQITRDHEVFNQLIDLGIDRETALARPDAHQLTQALGPNSSGQLDPAIKFFKLTEPTLFLLCSDGLCDNDVIEQNWQTHLLPIFNKQVDLETGLDNLMELGNNVNGHDNLTAILVMCDF